MANKDVNWEKLGLYIAAITLMFMFWQGWRDLHKDNSETKERMGKLEVRVEHLEK